MIRDLVRLGALAAIGIALAIGYGTYRIWNQASQDESRQADAIVVLGAAQYDGAPSPVFRARLDHAIDLWRQGLARWFVVTGGKQTGDRTTEAATARQYAMGHGVDPDRILSENRGRTTLESIHSVAGILRDQGVEDAIFVSDPSHMLRVLRMARDQGITAYGSPTRTSPTDRDLGPRFEATVHELGALALYFVVGDAPDHDSATEEGGPTPSP